LQHVGTLGLTWREVDLCIVQKPAVLVLLYFVYDCVTAALWLLYYTGTAGTAHVFNSPHTPPLFLVQNAEAWIQMDTLPPDVVTNDEPPCDDYIYDTLHPCNYGNTLTGELGVIIYVGDSFKQSLAVDGPVTDPA